MSSRPPLGTTGKICRKSPPRTMVFPPKIFSIAFDSLCKSIGILNLEWAVLRPRSSKDVIPNEATTSTILPCLRRLDKSVVQTNVFPIPPNHTQRTICSLCSSRHSK
ncbi:hypothetical protein CY35_07G093000 [Sphagnum magellanicum]|uniref:Uncharacterized protein n=1 Tax=Sphagnum magellanicum TaxID=128215 RepID=A0ACB8HMZ1_9BRYO|nr:hypothetical protein CY35_07G093000 [Sphagnum magellanicum]